MTDLLFTLAGVECYFRVRAWTAGAPVDYNSYFQNFDAGRRPVARAHREISALEVRGFRVLVGLFPHFRRGGLMGDVASFPLHIFAKCSAFSATYPREM